MKKKKKRRQKKKKWLDSSNPTVAAVGFGSDLSTMQQLKIT